MHDAERPGRNVRAFRLVEPVVDLYQGEISFLFYPGTGVRASDIQYNPPIDLAGVHALEDIVDVFEILCRDVGVDETFSSERQRLGQIQARAHDRAANREGLEHDLKDRQWEGAGRQPVERDGAARAGHADGLGKCRDLSLIHI